MNIANTNSCQRHFSLQEETAKVTIINMRVKCAASRDTIGAKKRNSTSKLENNQHGNEEEKE